MKRRSLFLGLLFISPWLIGFLLFTLYPLASSFYYSLTRYGLLNTVMYFGGCLMLWSGQKINPTLFVGIPFLGAIVVQADATV